MKRILLALVVFAAALSVHAYEKRDLLQRSATEAEVKASLVMDQKWVPYPAYTDRMDGTIYLATIAKAL